MRGGSVTSLSLFGLLMSSSHIFLHFIYLLGMPISVPKFPLSMMWKVDSLEKTLMLGKIEGRKRREQQKTSRLEGVQYGTGEEQRAITNSSRKKWSGLDKAEMTLSCGCGESKSDKDWCWSSSTLATWCKEPTHWKRPGCCERLKAKGEEDGRGWDV